MRKTWNFLLPGVGAAVLAVSPSIMAQDRSAEPQLPSISAQSQIMIDPATGLKIGPDDSSPQSRVKIISAAEFARTSTHSSNVQEVQRKNGTIMADVPEELHMHLVMVIDENGKRTLRHQESLTEIDTEADHGDTH